MPLSANQVIQYKNSPVNVDIEVASGAIRIYAGAILNRNTSGYAKLGGDVASEKFGGIALDELDQASGGSNGDNKIRVLAPGSGRWVKMNVTGTITRANIGDKVYSDGDAAGDLTAGVTNNVEVGTIREFIDANTAWVEI